jgi:hypothetical protein
MHAYGSFVKASNPWYCRDSVSFSLPACVDLAAIVVIPKQCLKERLINSPCEDLENQRQTLFVQLVVLVMTHKNTAS